MKKAYRLAGRIIRFGLAVVAISVLCNLSPAVAATYFWDGDGVGTQDGGPGLWNTTNLRWGADEGAAGSMIAWPNLAADTAVFDDVGGAVTIGGALNVGIIRTTIGGFTFGNGNGIGGAANTINSPTYDATHVSGTTSTSALHTGTVTKTGPGRVEINNTANPNSTKWVIQGGALTAPAPSRFGTNPGALVADFFKFDGGGLGGNTTAAWNYQPNWGVTITANGASFGATANTVIQNITGPIDAKGDITITGGGVFTGAAHTAGGILQLSNTSNAWTGAGGGGTINISGSSGSGMRLGASNVVPDQYTINLTVAGTFFDMNTNTASETVKAVKGTAGTVQVGAATLTIDNGNDAAGLASTYSSVFSSTATTAKIVKNGAGTQIFSGSSTGWTGEMELNAGKLGVGGNNSLGSGVGAQLTLKGGTLSNINASGRTISTNLAVNISGNFTVDDSIAQLTPVDGGVITFGGTNTIKGGNRTITVSATGGNLSLLTFASAIGEDAAGRGIIKEGNATLTLNAVNTYSGDTTINAGTINVDGDGTLGNAAGTLKLNGGRLNVTASRNNTTDPIANPINVTDNSAITTTSTAATVQTNISNNSVVGTAGKTLTIRNDAAAGTGAFQARFSGSGFNLASNVVLATGSVAATRTVELNSFNGTATVQTFSGDISGTGSYIRNASTPTGGGTTIFTGNNTYSGGTNVSRGTLLANNTAGSGTGSGAVTVGIDGTLGGTGSISGAVTVDGTLSPGASIESLATGAVSFGATSIYYYELQTNQPLATGGDLLDVNGALNITTGATLTLNELGAGFQPSGTKYTLISYDSYGGGTFAGYADDSQFNFAGKQWRIDYNDSSAGSNFAFDASGAVGFVTITAVPELSSIVGMGLTGFFAIGAVWMCRRMGVNPLKV